MDSLHSANVGMIVRLCDCKVAVRVYVCVDVSTCVCLLPVGHTDTYKHTYRQKHTHTHTHKRELLAACMAQSNYSQGPYRQQPGNEGLVGNQRHPQREVPVQVFQTAEAEAGIPAQENHNRLVLCGNEPQQEHVPTAAVVALKHRVTQRATRQHNKARAHTNTRIHPDTLIQTMSCSHTRALYSQREMMSGDAAGTWCILGLRRATGARQVTMEAWRAMGYAGVRETVDIPIGVQRHLLVLPSHQVLHDVGTGSGASSVAEPLVCDDTLRDARLRDRAFHAAMER
jgi:hypothetical protein